MTDDRYTPMEQAASSVVWTGVRGQRPDDTGHTVRDFAVGDVIDMFSRGYMRRGVVEAVGRKNVTMLFTTPGALHQSETRGWAKRYTRKTDAANRVRLVRKGAAMLDTHDDRGRSYDPTTAGQSGTTKEEQVTTEAPATPDAKPAKGKAEPRLRSPLGVCPGTGQAPAKALGTRAVPKSKQRYTGAENGPWGECPVCGHAKPLAKDGGTVVRHRITEAVATKLGTKVLPKQRTSKPAAAKAKASKGKTKAPKAKAASKPAAAPMAAASTKPQPKPRAAKPKPRAAVGEKSRGPKSLEAMLTLRQ